MSFSYISSCYVISRFCQTKARWLASWLTAPGGVAVVTTDKCLVTPRRYLWRVRRFSPKRPLHLLVCVFSSFFFHLKRCLLCCFLLVLCRLCRISVCCSSCVVPFCVVVSLSLPLSQPCFFSYILSLMILTIGRSIMVSTINPSLPLPLLLLLSFSVTAWGYEIRSPSGNKSIFFIRQKHALREHKKQRVPLQGEISHGHTCAATHTEMSLRNEIAVERWIWFITGLEVAITAKTDRQRKVRQQHYEMKRKERKQKYRDVEGGRHVNRNIINNNALKLMHIQYLLYLLGCWLVFVYCNYMLLSLYAS